MRILLSLVVLALVVVAPFVDASPVLAAQPTCQAYHYVYKTDTLRSISKSWNVPAWDIVTANRDQMTKPNYPIFLATKLCIPKSTGTLRTLPAWVLDQPVAQMIPRVSVKTLYVDVYNFPLNSNWFVKVDNAKIGKLKVVKKAHTQVSFRLPPGAKRVCLKNQMTDFLYCAPVVYPR